MLEFKFVRYIFLLFSILIGSVVFFYSLYHPEITLERSAYSSYLVSCCCLLLFVLSYIRYFFQKPNLLTYIFRIIIVGWFVTITAINHFAPDYTYSLIFILFILGFLFPSSRHFAIFYFFTFALIIIYSFYYEAKGIDIKLYLTFTFFSGIFIYFILRNREADYILLQKFQTDSKAILENSFGLFFYIDKNYKIISFNKFAYEHFNSFLNKKIQKGNSFLLFIPVPNISEIKNNIDRALLGEVSRCESNLNYDHSKNIWIDFIFVPIYSNSSKLLGVSVTGIDITKEKTSQIELSKQNLFLETLLDTIHNPIFYKDNNGIYTSCNKSFEDFIGFPKDKIIGCTVHDISPSELSKIYHNRDMELIENGGTQNYESVVKLADGTLRHVIFNKTAFVQQDKTVGGIVGIIVDITKHKQIEKALMISEARFREMADTLPLLIYEADQKGNVTYFNKIGSQITGYDQRDYEKGLNLLQMFPPEEKHRALTNSLRTLSGQVLGAHEFNLLRKDGSIIPVIISTVPIFSEGRIVGRRGVVTDISQIKEAEVKVRNSLQEKEILLKEIHHRVKNNLQVIIAMLKLQCQEITDPKILNVFVEAVNRIKSMSLVHENLYKAQNFSQIRIKDYISDLVHGINISYNRNNKTIDIQCKVEDITLNLDTSLPLGLIVNELVTNSIKYAFPEKSGKIFVSVETGKNNLFILTVKDNGIGIKQPFNIEDAKSLGLKLVNMISTQLNAEVKIFVSKGTEITITFKEYNGKE